MNFNLNHISIYLGVAVTGFILRSLYLWIASAASNKSIVGKIRKPVKLASWGIVASMVFISIADIFRIPDNAFVAATLILFAASALSILLSLMLTLFNQSCRFRIMRGINNTKDASDRTLKNRYVAFTLRLVGRTFKLMVVIVTATASAYIYILRLGGGSYSSSEGTRSPYEDHGDLDDFETSKRNAGQHY